MNPALRTAATGMAAQQTRTEVIANNLANVNTTAFKASRAAFEDLLYQSLREVQAVDNADASSLGAIQVGRGVRLAAINRIHAQGTMENTQRQLDLAIEGNGFFGLRSNTGATVYTRDGNFDVSDQGVLVNKQGLTLEPRITIPEDATDITIGPSGIVSAVRPGGTIVEVGRIPLYKFPNPSGLVSMGGNLYQESPSSGTATMGGATEEGFGTINQGYLEASNVEIVTEMVEMISAQRAYEINSKAIQTTDQMLAKLAQL